MIVSMSDLYVYTVQSSYYSVMIKKEFIASDV